MLSYLTMLSVTNVQLMKLLLKYFANLKYSYVYRPIAIEIIIFSKSQKDKKETSPVNKLRINSSC